MYVLKKNPVRKRRVTEGSLGRAVRGSLPGKARVGGRVALKPGGPSTETGGMAGVLRVPLSGAEQRRQLGSPGPPARRSLAETAAVTRLLPSEACSTPPPVSDRCLPSMLSCWQRSPRSSARRGGRGQCTPRRPLHRPVVAYRLPSAPPGAPGTQQWHVRNVADCSVLLDAGPAQKPTLSPGGAEPRGSGASVKWGATPVIVGRQGRRDTYAR